MKHYHKNPRQISARRFGALTETLRELGDLSGIVHDLNSDEIVGGNQRGRVFNIDGCEIVLVQQFDEPDEQGTVALGFVLWEGKRYAYRAVRWTPEQCEKANIVANSAGGDWNWDIIANEWNVSDLSEWGFDGELLKAWNDDAANLALMIQAEEDAPDVEFKEYDESIADEVEYIECPECGHRWPK